MTTFRSMADQATKAAAELLESGPPLTGGSTVRAVARALAATSAVTAGVAGALGVSWLTLARQARDATSTIQTAARSAAAAKGLLADDALFNWQDLPPSADGVYLPDGTGPLEDGPTGTRVLTLMGDSTSVGYGCSDPDELPAVVLARGAAAALHIPIRVTTRGAVGATSTDLARQLVPVLADAPDAAVILAGANDVTHKVAPHHAATAMASAVRQLRDEGVAVVVASCPDLGVITPIPQPLRHLVGVWSRILAREQERAVTAAEGVVVPLARVVSPGFYGHPDLFYADGFHPSGEGYARAIAALMPEVIEALR